MQAVNFRWVGGGIAPPGRIERNDFSHQIQRNGLKSAERGISAGTMQIEQQAIEAGQVNGGWAYSRRPNDSGRVVGAGSFA